MKTVIEKNEDALQKTKKEIELSEKVLKLMIKNKGGETLKK